MVRTILSALLMWTVIMGVTGEQAISSVPLPERTDQNLLEELKLDSFGERLLIVVPHPDDETIAAGGLIQRALLHKKQVRLVVVTNGDGFRKAAQMLFQTDSPQPDQYRQLGELRQRELLRAAASIGLSPAQVHFLGYPDGGLHRLWIDHWPKNRPYTGRTGSQVCPYEITERPQAGYSGSELEQLLYDQIDSFRPTDIVYPARQDRHDDHWATQAFVQRTLIRHSLHVREWAFPVHFPGWPRPHSYQPQRAMEIPEDIRHQGRWHSLSLTEAEVSIKYRALHAHQSQIRVMRDFLESFIRRNELFSSIR